MKLTLKNYKESHLGKLRFNTDASPDQVGPGKGSQPGHQHQGQQPGHSGKSINKF
ncbi:hypothetical protein [Legionella clemsonensis]|uniref:Uncharacterized protein n=1 Tax=Legionella clemsonensis TaxID=1867846 RepID=A0A222P6C2_9GAMM|nr:hypothetical protein [Legionella clemsonensis]ASQ47414.1 hypothetical protein clem_14440 [Legionella clemsonensis]